MNPLETQKYQIRIQKLFGLMVISGIVFGVCAAQVLAKPVTIKIATLVPKGSDYYQVLQDVATDWETITDGNLRVIIYPGGVSGDEMAIVRKMRIDQLQAGAVSTKGLHFIHESVYGLNYPMMVHSWDELDWLRDRLGNTIEKHFSERGFKLLFWADVGWIYFFSTKPIEKPDDVKNLKLFTRATDFNDLDLWKLAGFNPVPLTTNDVLPGLQTGLINVVQTPAFLALSSQWFGIANHMLDLKWAAMSGGFIITKKAWERIPEKYHDQLAAAAAKHGKRIQTEIRYKSGEAIEIMKKHGLKIYTPDSLEKKAWQKETETYYPKFEGVLVPEAMHNKVMALYPKLEEYRVIRQDTVLTNSSGSVR